MKTVIKIVLVGWLGSNPELRYLKTGCAVVTIDMVTLRAGEKKGTWHRLTAFQSTAETIGKQFKKGSHVGVEGRLIIRKWNDIFDVERAITEIIIDKIYRLGEDRNPQDDLINPQETCSEETTTSGGSQKIMAIYGIHPNVDTERPACYEVGHAGVTEINFVEKSYGTQIFKEYHVMAQDKYIATMPYHGVVEIIYFDPE